MGVILCLLRIYDIIILVITMVEINPNTVKSLYLEVCYDDTIIGNATGFLVKKGKKYYLITNRHVVTGKNNETGKCLDEKYQSIPNNLKVWIPYYSEFGIPWKIKKIELVDYLDNKLWIEHPIYKEKVDVVALEITDISTTITHKLDTSHAPVITEKVFIIGYPFGYLVNHQKGRFAIWSTGTVASEPDLNLIIGEIEVPAFLIDSKTRKGQSGSPVIYYNINGIDCSNGETSVHNSPIIHEVGIYSGRINAESDLGYVWKWSVIKEILDN